MRIQKQNKEVEEGGEDDAHFNCSIRCHHLLSKNK